MDQPVLIRNAEVSGHHVDVRIDRNRIIEINRRLRPRSGENQINARRGALLPGLHDHHIHLYSLAAALESVDCSPTSTPNIESLRHAIAAAPSHSDWIRGAGYYESTAGDLDREILDRICPHRPIRIQHRSGSMWFLNSKAIEALDLDDLPASELPPEGVERDSAGRCLGRLFRLDGWLGARIPRPHNLDLSSVGQLLASRGVTGVTDATPVNGEDEFGRFGMAQAKGCLPQRLHVMGNAELDPLEGNENLSVGAFKILLDEPALPDFDELADSIRMAHAASRPVAIHTVTRSEIHFALAALDAARPFRGDRLEHASVAPPEAIDEVSRLGITIVTQPNFVAERGDDYLEAVDSIDLEHLYRLRSWTNAGVDLAGGTDAPFGRPDPWLAIRSAVERRTATGKTFLEEEALTPERALGLFLTKPGDPGGTPRRIEVGACADLCLLDRPWADAREVLSEQFVAATIRRDCVLWASSDLAAEF